MKDFVYKEFRPKTFFRHVALEKLEEFLHNSNIDITSLNLDEPNNYIELIANEYDKFPENIKDELVLINNIANDKGMPYLVEACLYHNIKYEGLTPFDLALTLFNKNKKAFDYAYNWVNIDQYQSFHDFLGNEAKEPNLKNFDLFKNALIDYLKNQSKGCNVNVEEYSKDNKLAYIINYEDYLKIVPKFEDEKLINAKERPVKELVLIYYPNLAKLKIHAITNELENTAKSLFAKYILEDEVFFESPTKKNLYDLNILALFPELISNPKYGIEQVRITSLRVLLTSDGLKSEFKHPKELVDRLRQLNLDISNMKILKAGIKFIFQGKGKGREKTIYITPPNTATLSDSSRDEIIAKCLVDWEIANA